VYTRGRPVQHGAEGFPDHTGPRHQERRRCRPAAAIALAALTAAITAALTAALTAFPASSTHTSGALTVLTSAARRPHRRATASAHPAATTWLLELECGHARASRVHPPCPSCWPHPRSPRSEIRPSHSLPRRAKAGRCYLPCRCRVSSRTRPPRPSCWPFGVYALELRKTTILSMVAFSTKVGHEPVAERQRVAMLQAASAAAREAATVVAWAAVASAGRWRG
jgi:hypothetical protein